jgi:enoyl-CoA hydratase
MTVRVERDGPVTTVVLDRPDRRNAVDDETARALVAAWEEFDADDEAHVGVLYGDHGTFCGGGDLTYVAETGAERWLESLHFPHDRTRSSPPGPMGCSRMRLSKPVIAAVAGPAVAGGMELALWCDLRVVEESAYFGVYCRRWGVPLIDGGTVRLPRLIGQSRALDIILTGRPVPAAEALEIGLANRVVADGTVRQAAGDLAREIARFPQECVRADLRSVHHQDGLPLHDALRFEYANGLDAMRDEGVPGARRFAEGHGRHGSFSDI